ncbi:MAG: sce7726 family protein [Sagittula sp.]|jgi:hypothetical protein|uniref:sce7726 family protein n=1 Tax=Sagittula sp. TaxID=2038081 RepID=UPI004059B0EE
MNNCNAISASAVSRFFSRTVIKELAKTGQSPMFARLLVESGIDGELTESVTIGEAFECAFGYLRQAEFRHEYAYKAALTHRVLLGTHSLNTASMITEFRVGRCKADVVILNGTGTVYEIKSERDSLTRLERQIEEYRKVFASVNVIVGENHLASILDAVPSDVGILRLSGRYQISEIRAAQNIPDRTSAANIFDVVSMREAGLILKDLGYDLPDVPNTRRYQAYLEVFRTITSAEVHRAMVKVLKKTRTLTHLAQFIQELPASLQSVALSTKISNVEFGNLIEVLNVPLAEAKGWAAS